MDGGKEIETDEFGFSLKQARSRHRVLVRLRLNVDTRIRTHPKIMIVPITATQPIAALASMPEAGGGVYARWSRSN